MKSLNPLTSPPTQKKFLWYTPEPLTFFAWKYLYRFTLKNSGVWNDTIALPIQIFWRKSTCIALPLKILGFETIQSFRRFKIFCFKVLVSLHLWKFRGLKRHNRFADTNFFHKSTCITSSLKTSGIWSDTIALSIFFSSKRVSESL